MKIKTKVIGICAAVILIGIASAVIVKTLVLNADDSSIPKPVVAAAGGDERISDCGVVEGKDSAYVGMHCYKSKDYAVYYDGDRNAVVGVECLTEPKSGDELDKARLNAIASSYIEAVAGKAEGEVEWKESMENGLYELNMAEYQNGVATGKYAYCAYNNSGALIAASFGTEAISSYGDRQPDEKEAYEIFMSCLRQDFSNDEYFNAITQDKCKITQTTIGGEKYWDIVYLVDNETGLIQLSDDRLFSGYSALINVRTGEVYDASPMK